MIFTGQKTLSFLRDERLINHIGLFATVDLTKEDIETIYFATTYLANHPDFFNKRSIRLDYLIVGNGKVEMVFDGDIIGQQLNLAVINYDKYTTYPQTQKLVILIEEAVHHFWDSKDEIFVSKIVCEILPNLDYNRENGNYIYL
jgi:hypothetical protein